MIDEPNGTHKPVKVIRLHRNSVATVIVTRDWYALAMVSSSTMRTAQKAAAESLRETVARLARENVEMISDVGRAIDMLEKDAE